MLSKCSGPSCVSHFLHLGDGMLFRLTAVSDPGRLEYFWLCNSCSLTMTLRLSEDGSAIAIPLAKLTQGSLDEIEHISPGQEKGLVLRSVTFPVPEPLRDRARARLKGGRRVA